jgi:hypothetical protein
MPTYAQRRKAMTTVQAAPTGAALNTTWQTAPTHTIKAGGVEFAYRQLGPSTGVPVVFLTHLAAVLDNWDPPSRGRHRRQASGDHL